MNPESDSTPESPHAGSLWTSVGSDRWAALQRLIPRIVRTIGAPSSRRQVLEERVRDALVDHSRAHPLPSKPRCWLAKVARHEAMQLEHEGLRTIRLDAQMAAQLEARSGSSAGESRGAYLRAKLLELSMYLAEPHQAAVQALFGASLWAKFAANLGTCESHARRTFLRATRALATVVSTIGPVVSEMDLSNSS